MPLSTDLQRALFHNAEQVKLPRKTVLQRADEPMEWIYWLVKGVGVAYANVDTGDLYTRIALYLLRAADLILPIVPSPNLATSPTNIELASDALLCRQPFGQYLDLRKRNPDIPALEQRYHMDTMRRHLGIFATLRTMRTVTERMYWLIRQMPNCFQVLPDQVIGDLIGGFSREIVCKNKPRVIEMYHAWRNAGNM